jgi:hypothetical protein
MFRTIAVSLAVATALSLSAPAGFASSSSEVSSEVSTQIQDKLTTQGYEVRKIQMEDGLYEVYVIKEGQRLELYLDTDLEIVRSKTDD